jgi:hypothetical protein
MNVVTFDDHVAQIDADAKDDLSVVLLFSIAFRHTFLDFDSALNSIDDTCELDQQSVTRGLDDAASSVRDGRLDQLSEMGVEPGTRPRLVLAHETAVADDIGGEDSRKPSLDAFFGHDPSLSRVFGESLFGALK